MKDILVVQIFCAVNQIVFPIYLVVPNPYILLSSIPLFTTNYSSYLKYTFFTVTLSLQSHFTII